MMFVEDVIPKRRREAVSSRFPLTQEANTRRDWPIFSAVFFCGRFSRVVALTSLCSIVSHISITTFLFLLFAFSSLFFVTLQQPWKHKRKITFKTWVRITLNGSWMIVVMIFFVVGLRNLGVFACVAFETAEYPLVLMVSFWLGWEGWNHRKARACIVYGMACLLLLISSFHSPFSYAPDLVPTPDSNDLSSSGTPPESASSGKDKEPWDTMSNVVPGTEGNGTQSTTIGVFSLIFAMLLSIVRKRFAKRLNVEVGGSKRTFTLSCCSAAGILFPFLLWIRFSNFPGWSNASHIIYRTLALSITFIVLPYYTETIAVSNTRGSPLLSRLSFPFSLASAMVLSYFGWDGGTLGNMTLFFILAAVAIEFAVVIATSSSKNAGKVTASIQSIAAACSPSLLVANYTQFLTAYLVLNGGFMVIEIIVGVINNSLGMISDGFHMFFDCIALGIGLYASVAARWKPDKKFTYGYERFQVLGGLVNSILLLCIAAFVSIRAIARFFKPEDVGVDRLLGTSIVGFLINLIGVAAVFGHQTTDAGRRDLNVRALFIHVSADCAGSLAVIISSFLVDQYNLFIADAIASLVVGLLIFVSAVPIVRSAVTILMQGLTQEEQSVLEETMLAVRSIDGVVDVMNSHFWMITTMSFVINLRVKLRDDADEQKSLDAVLNVLRERGIRDVCVQMEKLDFVKRYSFHSISQPEEFGVPEDRNATV
eukprot:TRINITY_DN1944_c0_g1_i1.p1 TRINITY_DN1944_c0_g1~~TRINITY_DN1944_c0_g1_i1.p1  ORF type:complete len:709 (+),score=164.23 TRINITY_DN1944_c0_g1_i1:101-2227(+)